MTKGENTISGITFLIIGAIFGQIAWKVRSMSRGWTIGGLSLAALLLLSDFTREPSPITLLIHGVVFLYFFHTLRAVLSYDRLLAEQPYRKGFMNKLLFIATLAVLPLLAADPAPSLCGDIKAPGNSPRIPRWSAAS